MIIPLIECDDAPSPDSPEFKIWQTELIQRCLHWRIFGAVGIRFQAPSDRALLPVVIAVGGLVDLELELDPADASFAIEYLNHGAARIVCTESRLPLWQTVIPEERLMMLTDSSEQANGSTSRLRLSEPSVSQVASCFRKRVPIQIPTQWLETHPDFLAHSLGESLKSDRPDGLWPTIIVDQMNTALGLAYSNQESLLASLDSRKATYWSRSRNELWEKGKTSGATQKLLAIAVDCDADCLRFQVEQKPPGFCHHKTHTCFGTERTIHEVVERLKERIGGVDGKSFTRKLANDPKLLEAKLLEEAQELADATERHEIVWEAADVLYFALVKMANNEVGLEEVYAELARRMNRVERRKNKLEADDSTEKQTG